MPKEGGARQTDYIKFLFKSCFHYRRRSKSNIENRNRKRSQKLDGIAVFFRFTHDVLSERGATRNLENGDGSDNIRSIF